MSKEIWVCSNCGSQDVEVKAWIDANSHVVRDIMDHDDEDTYCNVCCDHHGIEILKEQVFTQKEGA